MNFLLVFFCFLFSFLCFFLIPFLQGRNKMQHKIQYQRYLVSYNSNERVNLVEEMKWFHGQELEPKKEVKRKIRETGKWRDKGGPWTMFLDVWINLGRRNEHPNLLCPVCFEWRVFGWLLKVFRLLEIFLRQSGDPSCQFVSGILREQRDLAKKTSSRGKTCCVESNMTVILLTKSYCQSLVKVPVSVKRATMTMLNPWSKGKPFFFGSQLSQKPSFVRIFFSFPSFLPFFLSLFFFLFFLIDYFSLSFCFFRFLFLPSILFSFYFFPHF